MKNLLSSTFTALFLILIANTAVYSVQTENEDPDLLMDEEALLFSDVPSVFSASKYEQKVTEAPARISIITADEIQRYGHRTLVDVLNTVPGFQTSYDRNYSYLGSRGFNISGDYNTRFLFLVDGHRLNENIYDSVVIDAGFQIDLDLVERVEVVRGPASSLYGSNAFLGVINVITKRGRDIEGLQISTSAGTHDSYYGRSSYGKRMENGTEVLISVSGYNSDGDDHLYYAEFDDPSTHYGVAKNTDDANNQNFFAKLSFTDFTLTGSYDKYQKGIPTASYDTIFNDSKTRTWESHAYLDLQYQTVLDNGADLNARIFYDNYWYDGNWAYDYADPGDPLDYVIGKEKAIGHWWGSELQISQDLFDQHHLTAGIEYRKSLSEKQKTYDRYGVYLDIDTDSYVWAAFIQDEYHIADDLILNLGLRYDYYSTFANTTNPRLALIWNPLEKTSIKLLYGTAFRAPNPYELYYHDGYDTQKPSMGLDPETIKSYELILEQQLNHNLNLVSSVYYNNIEDLISLTLDKTDHLLVVENKGSATSQGFELELQGNWENGWSGSASYSYQQADDHHHKRLVNYPRNMAKLNIIVPLEGNNFSAGLEMQYESGRKTLNGNDTDSHLITNLTLFNKNWIKNLKLSASIYNLFDEAYSQPAGEEHVMNTIEQDGQTFRLKMIYTF